MTVQTDHDRIEKGDRTAPARTHDFDIAGPAFKRDPYPTFAAMRKAGPVIRVKAPFVGKIWVTTTHAATLAAVKDSELFILEGNSIGKGGIAGFNFWIPKSVKLLTNSMLQKDEPDHRRLRKLVDQAFGRRGILEMRSGIEAVAGRLLDDLAGEGDADLIDSYSRRLPMVVICDLLGLPEEDYPVFSEWANSLTNVKGAFDIPKVLTAVKKLTDYLRVRMDAARAAPGRGIISELVRAEADGEKLNADELISMVVLLLVAGFETTTNLIAGSIIALDQNSEQKIWLLRDPEARMERAVEELARYVSAVQGTKPRYVSRDTVFFGQALKQGEVMMALPALANADPAVFEAPDKLNLDRFPNAHLAFSSGIHFCLGMQLARVETQSALAMLYVRYPDLTIPQPEAVVYAQRLGMRGVSRLPVRLGAHTA